MGGGQLPPFLMKRCYRCEQIKPPDAFYSDKSRLDGKDTVCRICRSEVNTTSWAKHKQARNEKKREYHQRFPLERKERNIKWRSKNKERCHGYCHKWEKNHRDMVNARHHRHRQNPMIRLHQAISAGIRAAIASWKNGRSWESLVGYTLADLRFHLEAQFLDGMTWENYGAWHIDHKIPVSWWHFGGPEDSEFKQCWALCNLQPLWAVDNLTKGHWRAA